MRKLEFEDVRKRLLDLAEAYDRKPPGDGALRVWWDTLEALPVTDVLLTLADWARSKQKFPTPAEVFAVANDRGIDRREEKAAELKAQEKREVEQFFRGKTPEGTRALVLIKDMLAAKAAETPDPRAWARKILDRYVDGEKVPHMSLVFACEALHKNLDDIRELRRELEPA